MDIKFEKEGIGLVRISKDKDLKPAITIRDIEKYVENLEALINDSDEVHELTIDDLKLIGDEISAWKSFLIIANQIKI